jgi:transposase
VQAYVAQYRQDQGLAPKTRRGMPTPPLRRVALRQAVGWVMRRPDDLTDTEQHDLACLQQASPAVTRACGLAQDFADMVRARAAEHLDAWLERAAACEIAALRGFATGLRQDYAAVRAALSLPWSTGQVEGQINRLKTIKRQAYGRAKFDLLRQRVLLAA